MTYANVIKKYSKYLDFILKGFPLLILLFLICNFSFNMGYFFFLGIKFASLLEIRDYYEGTAPFITFVILLFWGIVNILIYSSSIKFYFKYIFKLIKVYLLSIKSHYKVYKFLLFRYRTTTYQEKREFINILHDLKAIGPTFEGNFVILIFISLAVISIILAPFVQIYILVYKISKILFLILFCVYLILLLINLLCENKFFRIMSSIFMIIFIIFLLGIWMFINNYKNCNTEVITNDNITYTLIRPISNGAIVKNNDSVLFLNKDNIKQFKKSNEYIYIDKK